MKHVVLVVVPTIEEAYHGLRHFASVSPPVGLATIAAVFEKLGYRVTLIDGDAENLTFREALDRVCSLKPDYVGTTTMTATMDFIQRFFVELKARLPETVVMTGGPHVSALPARTIDDCAAIDYVICGEGEETLAQLMPMLESGGDPSGVAGIAFRRNGRTIATARRHPPRDLSISPMPAYHLMRFDLYRSYAWNNWVSGYRQPHAVMFSGRGCLGECNFCGAQAVFGHGIRYFPIERIRQELDLLVNRFEVRVLYFEDDTFTANRKVVNEICDYIIERGYNSRLEIMVSARCDTVNIDTMRKMRQAGIRWICFGVESGNQAILDRMHKKIRVEQVSQAFDLAHEAGLYVAGNYMIGHLGETWDTAMDTIRLACSIPHEYASFAIAIPLPGTELYDYALANGIALPSWSGFGSVAGRPIPLNESLSAAQLMELRRIASMKFFGRPSYIMRMLRMFRPLPVLRDFITTYLALRKEMKEQRF